MARSSKAHRDMNKFLSATGVRGIIALARSNLGVKDQAFDFDHDLIGCQNGVLNLRTGELSKQPGSIVTRRIAAVYDLDVKRPEFLKFLNEIFKGDQEVISNSAALHGLHLTRRSAGTVSVRMHRQRTQRQVNFPQHPWKING